jgi:hypothetical protein
MSSLLVFNRVYRMEIQSVMLVFSTPLVNCCPYNFSLTYPTPSPSSQRKRTVYSDSVCLWGGVGGVELCCRPYSANTLFLTSFRTYKITTPPHTKTPIKTTFRDWCLYSFFVHAFKIIAPLKRPCTCRCWWPAWCRRCRCPPCTPSWVSLYPRPASPP